MFACNATLYVNYGKHCTPYDPWKEGSPICIPSQVLETSENPTPSSMGS